MTLITWFDIPWSEELSKIFQKWAETRITRLWFDDENVTLDGVVYLLTLAYMRLVANEENWGILHIHSVSPIYSLLVLDPNLAKVRFKYLVGLEGIDTSARPNKRSTELYGSWLKTIKLDMELDTTHNYLYILYYFSRWSIIDGRIVHSSYLFRLLPQLLL